MAEVQGQNSKSKAFHKEYRTLLIILGIFDLTYLLRAGWDYNCFGLETLFGIWAGSLILCTVFDIVPIGLILLFHYRNFRSLTPTKEKA